MTDPAPAPESTPASRDVAELIAELGARQDRAVERLTTAVAKVLSDAARAEAQARSDQMILLQNALTRAVDDASIRSSGSERTARREDAESLRTELAGLLAALQAGVVERVGQASASEAEALRAALAAGVSRVGDRITETLRSELTRLEVTLDERLPKAPDGTPMDLRDQLLAEVRQVGEESASALDVGFASMRATLAEVAHDSRTAAAAVAALVAQGLDPLRAEVTQGNERIAAVVADLQSAVEEAAKADRHLTEERVERLRTELVVSLGALEEAYKGPVEALRGPIDDATSAVEAAAMARALDTSGLRDELTTGLGALQAQVDQLVEAVRGVERTQEQLRSLVAQLWGGEPPA